MIVNGYNSDDPTSKVVNVSINKMKDKNIQGSLFSIDKGQVFMLVLACDPTKKRSHLIFFEIESLEQVKHKFEEHYRLGNHSWNARSVVLYQKGAFCLIPNFFQICLEGLILKPTTESLETETKRSKNNMDEVQD
eukprot:TRINITY_DN5612_c0_g1_i6.p1 TRINITY_DN5612_c0_g1~~TRINITY_DN5612_c0_g1_i6.p1  ORF type:complete len:135 (+),score=13.55 TRINITY_DN5612_c0_g1_i6:189-593(+)